MRISTTSSVDVQASLRLDSKFFLDEGQLAYLHVNSGSWPMVRVTESLGGDVMLPNRFERVPASSPEHGKPLLVPYDCFRYRPWSDYILSRSQIGQFAKLELRRGWMLIVCSGRNLGPAVIADSFLERFVLSHDMIRLRVSLSDELFYFAAFLHTKTGQALVRRDRGGSVIDHLTDAHIRAMQYPVVNARLKQRCATAFRKAFELRETARLELDRLSAEFLVCTGLANEETWLKDADLLRRFSTLRGSLFDRIDAEPYAPLNSAYRNRIQASGFYRKIVDVAHPVKPAGRYRTLYVEDEQFGVRLLSGRQIAQYKPIGLKIMSRTAWSSPEDYELRKGMVLLTADGRAEENLADCAMVRSDRDGWTASGHVHRLVPRSGTHPGLLYLACAAAPVQSLLKALATGSVVDALSVSDVASTMIPYPDNAHGKKLGDAAVKAWDMFSEAATLEEEAEADLEKEFARPLRA